MKTTVEAMLTRAIIAMAVFNFPSVLGWQRSPSSICLVLGLVSRFLGTRDFIRALLYTRRNYTKITSQRIFSLVSKRKISALEIAVPGQRMARHIVI